MKGSDALFRLIKALNKSEKRYFTVTSKTHRGESDALRLFKAIDSMEQYDDAVLRKKLTRAGADGKAIASRLDVTKVQLYNALMRTLRLYHENEYVESEILNLQMDCTILYDKGLAEEALRRVRKAKALAYEYEKLRLLPALLAREKELVLASVDANDLLKAMRTHEKEVTEVMTKITNLDFYSHWAHLMASSGRVTSAELRRELDEEFEQLLQTPVFSDPGQALSIHARRLQAYTCSTWYLMRQDFAMSYVYDIVQAEVMEAAPHLIGEFPKAYITAIYNAIVSSYNLDRLDETRRLIARLRALPEILPEKQQRSVDLRLRILSRVINMEFGILLRKADFDLKLVDRKETEDVIRQLAQSNDPIRGHEITLGYAIILFACGEHRIALEQLRPLLFERTAKMRGITAVQASLLFLMIHFDRGNEQMEKFIKDRLRSLETFGVIRPAEQLLFEWLAGDEAKFTSGKEQREAWTGFRIRFENALTDGGKMYQVDFLAWIDSKISGNTFAQCAKLRAIAMTEKVVK